MSEMHSFEAQLQGTSGGGCFCLPPLDVPALFGTKGQLRVQGTIDGHAFTSSLSPMGGGQHMLLVHKATRAVIGKQPGDVVHVSLNRDLAERTVAVPEELAMALAAVPGARTTFDALAFTHRKEFARWITDAKRPETRQRRLTQAVEMITQGKKLS
ncbi:YdeI/OmpD-associated family protein [Hymenobacter persicinus]|uniref:DUF1905 domain-containing protein n=1 Tax=Hymenobacter persicinus TaxID=2025506 RepID=A0A4Q5LAV4_9BACT|nr:YdeI/OmpD-associated family protein [Hymenobacter persicinus]RYU79144.1 DUF1905 domain-containing protein [Hymenobacter persicinus]